MSWPKGKPRPEGAGRKKGTPNKRASDLAERAKELNVDPFDVLLFFTKGDWKALGYKASTETKVNHLGIEYEVERITPEMRLQAAKEASQYIYPKRKALEHTGANGGAIEHRHSIYEDKSDDELDRFIDQARKNDPQSC